MVIVYRAMLNFETSVNRRNDAEPNSSRPIIRRHPHRAGIVPQAARNGLGERQATVPSYDAVNLGLVELEDFCLRTRRREYELIDLLRTAVYDRQPCSADLKIDTSW
jgi:hypothetical protein